MVGVVVKQQWKSRKGLALQADRQVGTSRAPARPPGWPRSPPELHMGLLSPQVPKPPGSQRTGFTGLHEVFRDASCQKQPLPRHAAHCVASLYHPASLHPGLEPLPVSTV